MVETKVWNKKKFWLILLGVFCVVVIGFGIGIVIDKNKKDINIQEETVGESNLDKSIAAGYYPGDEMSERAYTYDHDYLMAMIESGKTNDGQELDHSSIFSLQIVLSRLMIRYGKNDEALDYLNKVNQENLSASETINLYVAFSQLYQNLGDEEKALMYADMATHISNMEEQNEE